MSSFVLIREFISIVELVKAQQLYKLHNGYMVVDKEILEKILGHNLYRPVPEKLKFWKLLNFIATDQDRYTKRVYEYIGDEKKRVPAYYLNLEAYDALKEIEEF